MLQEHLVQACHQEGPSSSIRRIGTQGEIILGMAQLSQQLRLSFLFFSLNNLIGVSPPPPAILLLFWAATAAALRSSPPSTASIYRGFYSFMHSDLSRAPMKRNTRKVSNSEYTSIRARNLSVVSFGFLLWVRISRRVSLDIAVFTKSNLFVDSLVIFNWLEIRNSKEIK